MDFDKLLECSAAEILGLLAYPQSGKKLEGLC